MIHKCFAPLQCFHVPHHPTVRLVHPNVTSPTPSSLITTRRGALSTTLISTTLFTLTPPSKSATIPEFSELPNSGGVKALDLRLGDGQVPADGDQVSVHYYGRLAAKQGWRFDSTYDHKDENGEPIPFVFVIGSGKIFDRQRLFTTIFNPTRLANGEGSTLGTLVFDIELVSLRHQ
ncbi:unnamed protein product [Malus baccata var. baccata]